jgi:hypothetical protein
VSGVLDGKVALVAGATRGAGRGIATELGAAGATVYVTGRSAGGRRSEIGRPETLEETAERVTAAGGRGIAVAVDHLEPDQVAALVERIDAEQGRLDVLVNNIWGGELLVDWNVPVWEHDLQKGLHLLHLAIDTHLITSHHALPLLIREPGGHGRHGRVQRRELPPVHLLRPRQERRDPDRLGPGPRARPARRHGGDDLAGLAAVGDDARRLQGARGELARRVPDPAALRDLGDAALRRAGRGGGRRRP